MVDRSTAQNVLRVAAVGFVVAWLFVERLREVLPFWLPFAVLLAAELEFVIRGRLEPPRPRRGRVAPGAEDADLGFGELVEDEEGVRWIPPPPRAAPRRGRRALWAAGALGAVALFAVAARADRESTWGALPAGKRASATARFASEAAIVARRPVTLRCDEAYAFTGAGSDTLGIAFPRAGIAYLDPSVCRALRDLLEDGRAGERQAEALVVLAHEAIHLGGERREGVTECLALQAAAPLGIRMGLDPEKARVLLRRQYEIRLAERGAIRAAYALPTTCREGGALDRTPDDGRFP